MREKTKCTGRSTKAVLRMRKTTFALAFAAFVVVLWPAGTAKAANESSENKTNHWETYNGKAYWYEGGVKQGTYDDKKGVIGDGTVRGREIYDPSSKAWYWLDACYDGAKACDKEVWMPYIYQNEKNWDNAEIAKNAASSGDMAAQVEREIKEGRGKWVRYDAEGRMIKGWYTVRGKDINLYPRQAGNTYYYDQMTGLMAKGRVNIDGMEYVFDDVTGKLIEGEAPAETRNVLAKMIVYNPDGSISSWTEYEYNSFGKETKMIDYNSDGSISSWSEWEYDSAGKETKMVDYNSDGSISSWSEWEYDSMGNQKTIGYDSDGSISIEFRFDSAGNITKLGIYGYIDSWYEYEYDSAGQCTKGISYTDGSIRSWFEIEYDSAEKRTKSITYNPDGSINCWSEWKYDSAGKNAKEIYYNSHGATGQWSEYEYNSAGQEMKYITHGSDGYILQWIEREYDSSGNETKYIEYNPDGTISSRTEYEYKTITIR